MCIRQSGKRAFTACSHASIPASPVLISCPPPTRQTTTDQSAWRSMYESRNSGSDCAKSAMFFLRRMNLRGHLQSPGALRLVEDRDVFRGRGGIDDRVIAEVMNVLDEGLHALPDLPLPHRIAEGALPRDLVPGQRLAKDRDERTVAREVDGRRAGVGVGSARGHVQADERFAGAGTPVTKQITFRFVRFASATSSSRCRDVTRRFSAPAS